MSTRYVLVLLGGALLLAGCGNKGNLIMPPPKPNQPQTTPPPPQPASTPALPVSH